MIDIFVSHTAGDGGGRRYYTFLSLQSKENGPLFDEGDDREYHSNTYVRILFYSFEFGLIWFAFKAYQAL